MFTPRNIEQRKERLTAIQTKKERTLKKLATDLATKLNGLKTTHLKDKNESAALSKTLADCQVKVDWKNYPDNAFVFDKRGKFLLELDTTEREIWINYDLVKAKAKGSTEAVLLRMGEEFKTSYKTYYYTGCQHHITEKYFKNIKAT